MIWVSPCFKAHADLLEVLEETDDLGQHAV